MRQRIRREIRATVRTSFLVNPRLPRRRQLTFRGTCCWLKLYACNFQRGWTIMARRHNCLLLDSAA